MASYTAHGHANILYTYRYTYVHVRASDNARYCLFVKLVGELCKTAIGNK